VFCDHFQNNTAIINSYIYMTLDRTSTFAIEIFVNLKLYYFWIFRGESWIQIVELILKNVDKSS
jgi:hypothetical protein